VRLIKGYRLISQKELDNTITDAEKRGGENSKQRIEELKRLLINISKRGQTSQPSILTRFGIIMSGAR